MSAVVRLPWVAPVVRAPAKYDHIDMSPTAGMRKAAARGKRLRKKHGRGGTHEGARTATAILSGDDLGETLIRKMHRYFTRFSGLTEEQRGTEQWDPTSDKVSNHRIAWDLWGGDPGRAWARARVRQMDAADREASKAVQRRAVAMPWARQVAAFAPPAGEQARGVYWRGWLDSIQRPTERRLRSAWTTMLRQAARRYARRAGRVLGDTRSLAGPVIVRATISQAELDDILDSTGEIEAMTAAVPRTTVRQGLQLSFSRAARQLAADLAWAPELDPTEAIIADMVTFVEQTTKDRIAKLVRESLSAGVQVNDLQKAIQDDTGFSPRRALRIARTETGKILSQGTRLAYQDAAAAGVSFRVQWLSARDEVVRADHQALDGQEIEPGGLFVVPDSDGALYPGASGAGPGEFAEAGLVCNCRCTTIPVLT